MTLIELAKTLIDMTELEQIRAEAAEERANKERGGKRVQHLEERDRHITRSRAFLEVIQLIRKDARI